jgi:hypothetical protein
MTCFKRALHGAIMTKAWYCIMRTLHGAIVTIFFGNADMSYSYRSYEVELGM